MVWKLGIPNCWKTSRTVPISKKGDTSDYSNFRPISLLPTIYKLFSGVISQRITEVASDLRWLSPEQKGFLPGVHGIQEHTQLLQTVVEETKTKRRHMSMAWLDMCNAFGSVPHAVLNELFTSLPILTFNILHDLTGDLWNRLWPAFFLETNTDISHFTGGSSSLNNTYSPKQPTWHTSFPVKKSERKRFARRSGNSCGRRDPNTRLSTSSPVPARRAGWALSSPSNFSYPFKLAHCSNHS